MITRRKDYSKKAPSKDSRKIFIICEGKGTEKDYFSFFEGLSSNLELIIITPEEGTDPIKLMELAKRKFLSETGQHTLDYIERDKIWFAIDTDTWEKENKIMPLREFCSKLNQEFPETYSEAKRYSAWNVAQSNPSFEIWLYYHHYKDVPHREEVESYPSIKSFVNAKISGGFDFQKDPVRLKDAIKNSKKNFHKQENGNPDIFSTEQFLIGEEILSFVKAELDKLRNKMG